MYPKTPSQLVASRLAAAHLLRGVLITIILLKDADGCTTVGRAEQMGTSAFELPPIRVPLFAVIARVALASTATVRLPDFVAVTPLGTLVPYALEAVVSRLTLSLGVPRPVTEGDYRRVRHLLQPAKRGA